MGIALATLAAKVIDEEDLWDALNLRSPGTAVGIGGLCGFRMKTGWYIIYDHLQLDLFVEGLTGPESFQRAYKDRTDVLEDASKHIKLLVSINDEHCNYCATSEWHRGRLQWSVSHFLDLGKENLETCGKPPIVFENIKKQIIAERDSTPQNKQWDHFFSIPVNLFEELTGFNYANEPEIDGAPVVLQKRRKRKS